MVAPSGPAHTGCADREAAEGTADRWTVKGWPDRQRFIMVFELNTTRQNLKFNDPSSTFKFSNLLGYFPTIVPHLQPLINLSASQRSASLLLDLV